MIGLTLLTDAQTVTNTGVALSRGNPQGDFHRFSSSV